MTTTTTSTGDLMEAVVDFEKYNEMNRKILKSELEIQMLRSVLQKLMQRVALIEVGQAPLINPPPETLVYQPPEVTPLVDTGPLTEGPVRGAKKEPSAKKPIAPPPPGNVLQFPPKK